MTALRALYEGECRAAAAEASRLAATAARARSALAAFAAAPADDTDDADSHDDDVAVPPPLLPATAHYGCAVAFATAALGALDAAARARPAWRDALIAEKLPEALFGAPAGGAAGWRFLACGPAAQRAAAASLAVALARGSAAGATALGAALAPRATAALRHEPGVDAAAAVAPELELLARCATDAADAADSDVDPAQAAQHAAAWEALLRALFATLRAAVRAGGAERPGVAQCIMLPALRAISAAAREDDEPEPDAEDTADVAATSRGAKADYGAWMRGDDGSAFADFQARCAATKGTSCAVPACAVAAAMTWRERVRSRRAGNAISSPTASGEPLLLREGDWLCALLLCRSCAPLRSAAASCLRSLASGPQSRRFALLAALAGLLPPMLQAGPACAEALALLAELAAPPEARRFLAARGALRAVLEHTAAAANNVAAAATAGDATAGADDALSALAALASACLELPDVRARCVRDGGAPALLAAAMACARAGAAAGGASAAAAAQFERALTSAAADAPAAASACVAACVAALRSDSAGDASAARLPLSLLVGALCPIKPAPVYPLLLVKAPSQEEFIRGSCGRAPVPSSALQGPLMRHLKNHICRTLDLAGLLEDDYGLELLVAGRIIGLDVPIDACYDRVWRPEVASAQGGSGAGVAAMTVVYRLQGLDGEATEPQVTSLAAAASQEDPEVTYAGTALLADGAAFPALLALCGRWRVGARAAAPGGPPAAAAPAGASAAAASAGAALLRLLDAASQVRGNRAPLLAAGALPVLEAQAQAAFCSPRQAPAAEALLLVLERLVDADDVAAVVPASASQVEADGAAAAARARAFWAQLRQLMAAAGSSPAPRGAATVARVAARVAAGAPDAAAALAADVGAHLGRADATLAGMDAQEAPPASDDVAALRAAATLLAAPAPPAVTDGLRGGLVARGAVAALRRYLLGAAFPAGRARERGSPEFAASSARPALPLALALIAGIARGHAAAATEAAAPESGDLPAATSSGLLPLLHALEGAASGGVGTAAEEALGALCDSGAGAVSAAVAALRAATKEEARRKALAWREAMLRDMGMTRVAGSSLPGSGPSPPPVGSWGGGDRIVAASPGSLGALGGGDDNDDDDDDEEGDEGAGACAVCREGYRLRPGELLGVYVFSKRVPLAPAAAALAAAAAPADAAPGAAAAAAQPRGAAARLVALLGGPGGEAPPAATSSSSTTGQAAWGFTCVSHFNAIHASCHAAARRADGALRPPKREWDGSATRNHGTRCNALLPLRGQGVSDNAYAAAADAYWAAVAAAAGEARETRAAAAALQHAAGAAQGEPHASRARSAAHDLALLTRRLAFAASLTADARGGGRDSNACAAAALAQLAAEAMALAGDAVRVAARSRVDAWLASPDISPTAAADSSLGYMLALALVVQPGAEWRARRAAFLAAAVGASVAEEAASGTPLPADDDAALWVACRPWVTWVGLFDALQRAAKPPSPPARSRGGLAIPGSSAASDATADAPPADGDAATLARLRDLPHLLGRARQLPALLEEALEAADAEEGLDVLDALRDVAGPAGGHGMAPPPTSATEWMRRAAAGEGFGPRRAAP